VKLFDIGRLRPRARAITFYERIERQVTSAQAPAKLNERYDALDTRGVEPTPIVGAAHTD
jgi:hypothetical protein